METTINDAGQLRKQLTVTIPAEEIRERRNQLLDRYSNQVRIKGFRPGKKPPRSVVEKRLGAGLDEEIYQTLVEEGVSQAIKDNKLKPIGEINTDESNRDNGITHTVSFDIQPEITLPEAASIPVTIEDCTATEADLDQELNDLAARAGSYNELDAEATLGKDDIITLSGRVTHNGETIRDLQDLQHMVGSYPLLGLSATEVQALVEKLHVGEELAFTAKLPENFTPEEYANQEAQVSATIQSARRMEKATLDDELAKSFGMESLDALKERLSAVVEQRKQEALNNKQSDEVLDYLVANCSFELPEKIRSQVLEQRLEQERQQAADKGDQEKPEVDESAIAEDVDKELRRHLLVEAICDHLAVSVSEQDLNQQIAMAAYQSGRKPEEIAKQLKESGRINQVAAEIRSSKGVAQFVEQVVAAHQDAEQPAATESQE